MPAGHWTALDGIAEASAVEFEEKYVARLGPVADWFSDEDLYWVGWPDGPRIYALIDEEGLPIRGVIYDPATDRRTKFRLPIAGKAVA